MSPSLQAVRALNNARLARILAGAPSLTEEEQAEIVERELSISESLSGKLIAAGDLELFEDGKPVAVTGVFVECTRDALKNLRGNLIYAEVSIAPKKP